VSAGARAQALARLRAYLGVAGDEVRIASDEPRPWLQDFADAAPWLEVVVERALEETLRLEGSAPHGAIYFGGEPEGRLLESLAECLLALATHRVTWDTPASPARLVELRCSVSLRVYVGATCPFCPSVTAAALRMAVSCTKVDVEILRADQVPGAAVRSVPTTRLGGATLSTGAIAECELVDRMVRTASA